MLHTEILNFDKPKVSSQIIISVFVNNFTSRFPVDCYTVRRRIGVSKRIKRNMPANHTVLIMYL